MRCGWIVLVLLAGCSSAASVDSGSEATQHGNRSEGPATGTQRDGMVFLRGGSFLMGSDDMDPPCAEGCCQISLANERPAHEVQVAGFWIDKHEVSNEQFARFVTATGYVTDAEQIGNAVVFDAHGCGDKDKDKELALRGFRLVDKADWRQPEGPGSSIAARMSHPVVQVSWGDAAAYAQWAGKALQ